MWQVHSCFTSIQLSCAALTAAQCVAEAGACMRPAIWHRLLAAGSFALGVGDLLVPVWVVSVFTCSQHVFIAVRNNA